MHFRFALGYLMDRLFDRPVGSSPEYSDHSLDAADPGAEPEIPDSTTIIECLNDFEQWADDSLDSPIDCGFSDPVDDIWS